MNTEQEEQLSQAITGTFMWSFKKGDNIIYNLGILWELYKARDNTQAKTKLIKPIVLLQMAIVECILDDFVNRVKGHVYDKIPNITQAQIDDFKIKKRDQLEQYIAAAKKHNLFDCKDGFYSDMDSLRQARNRVHIQNSKYVSPDNESGLFDESLLRLSEKTFEVVVHAMMNKFYRWDGLKILFSEVPLPWKRATTLSDPVEKLPIEWTCLECGVVYPANWPYCPDCTIPRPW